MADSRIQERTFERRAMALGLTLAAVSTLALSNGRAMLGPVDQMAASVQNDPIAAQAVIERMASTLGAPATGFARSGVAGPARVAGVGTPLVPATAVPPAAQAAAAPPVDDAFGSGGPLDGEQLAGLGTPFTDAGGGGGNGGVGGGGVPGSLPGGGGGGGFVGALPGDGGTDGGGGDGGTGGGGNGGGTGGGDTGGGGAGGGDTGGGGTGGGGTGGGGGDTGGGNGGGGNGGGGDGGTPTPTAPIPEPGSWMMMILGIGMIGAALRRRRVPVRGGVATA